MAENNVSQWNRQDQSFEGVDWEEESYREGCAYARERASVRLKELDDRLLRSKPKGLRVGGFRERTVETRFGDVVVRRRMYRDQEGEAEFALDEYSGMEVSSEFESVADRECGINGDCGVLSSGCQAAERSDGWRFVGNDDT